MKVLGNENGHRNDDPKLVEIDNGSDNNFLVTSVSGGDYHAVISTNREDGLMFGCGLINKLILILLKFLFTIFL